MKTKTSVAGVLALAFLGACSGSQGNSMNSAQCTSNSLQVLFSPMYTYWDGVHSFQIPVVAQGVAATSVSWTASDTDKVSLAPDPNTGGIMITVNNSANGMALGGTSAQEAAIPAFQSDALAD